MSRPSKLNANQCTRAVALHNKDPKRWSAAKLAHKFAVSESSMYTVLNGTYRIRDVSGNSAAIETVAPQRVPRTPPLFNRRESDRMHTAAPDIDLSQLEQPDEVTLAAAYLIVAKSRFAQVLAKAKQH